MPHARPWFVFTDKSPHFWLTTADVCVCECVFAVMPVSRIRWSNAEGCTSCDGCVSIRPRVLFSDQSLQRWNHRSLYYAERAGQGCLLKLWRILQHSKAFYYYSLLCSGYSIGLTISVLDFMLLVPQQWCTKLFGHFSHTKCMKCYSTVLYNKISNLVSRFLKPRLYIFTTKKYIYFKLFFILYKLLIIFVLKYSNLCLF